MSHSTKTLRDKVWSVLNNVWDSDSEEDLYIKTDAILDLVREALLSNDVQAPIRQELHDYPRTSTRDTVKTVIDMALDAVAGEDDER